MSGLTAEMVEELRAHGNVQSLTVHDDRLAIALTRGASVAPIVAWLVQHGVAVEEVRKARATLEDAFLDLMGVENGEGNGRGDER